MEDNPLPYKMPFLVDIVFAIDITGSMSPILESFKREAGGLFDVIRDLEIQNGYYPEKIRLKVIGYRDLNFDPDAMQRMESEFTEDPEVFRGVVAHLGARGGGDEPESTLDAILWAIQSHWLNFGIYTGCRGRKIILVMTDASMHPLHSHSVGRVMSLEESIEYVREQYLTFPENSEERLIVIGPKSAQVQYAHLVRGIDGAIFVPCEPGKGLSDVDFKRQIIPLINDCIAQDLF